MQLKENNDQSEKFWKKDYNKKNTNFIFKRNQ